MFVQDKNVKDKETGMKSADIEWKKCLFGEGYTWASLPTIRNTRMEMENESSQNLFVHIKQVIIVVGPTQRAQGWWLLRIPTPTDIPCKTWRWWVVSRTRGCSRIGQSRKH